MIARRSVYTTRAARRASRGFTLAELIVASTISVLVLASVMALQYITARTAKELYGPAHSRSERMNALNQIRLRLCEASVGSCAVSDDGHRIQFVDPNLGGVTSEFYFNAELRQLYYNPDIASGSGSIVARGPIDITFTLGTTDLDVLGHAEFLGTDACVTLFVRTSADLTYGNVDTRDGETVVYLRNPVLGA